MLHRIKFGSRNIEFSLQYRKRKSVGIKVYPDNTVEISAPLEATEKQVFDMAKIKTPWIVRQLDHFNSFKPGIPPRRFINGETHLYLGRQYRLKIVPDKKFSVQAYRGQLWIHNENIKAEAIKARLDSWYKERASVIFNEILEDVLPKFKRYHIAKPSLSIRTMSKRWGSCTPSGKIILNPEIIKASKGCIEYVIIHELCHLIHHNHTKEFQNLQCRMMPDWYKWKNRLEYGLVLS